jgi:NADH-quinone oxidoreductase subunit J
VVPFGGGYFQRPDDGDQQESRIQRVVADRHLNLPPHILLNAQFLAIVNIIVYAGAIMVLFLFVIMLMNLNKETEPQKNRWLKIAGALAGGCLMLILVAALKDAAAKEQVASVNQGNIGLIKKNFLPSMVTFNRGVLFLSNGGAVVTGRKSKNLINGWRKNGSPASKCTICRYLIIPSCRLFVQY